MRLCIVQGVGRIGWRLEKDMRDGTQRIVSVRWDELQLLRTVQ